MKLESAAERRVCKWADEHGIMYSKLAPPGRRHWPDRVFWLGPRGAPLLIEFKRKGERPRKAQFYILKRLREEGYDARWTDDAEEAISWLEFNRGFKKTAQVPKTRRGAIGISKR